MVPARRALEGFHRRLRGLWIDESAPTAVEYALMAAGITLVVVGVVFLIGGNLADFFESVDVDGP